MKKVLTVLSFAFLSMTAANAQCSLTVTIQSNNPSCAGFCDGTINVLVQGATGTPTFLITDSTGTQVNPGGANMSNTLCEGWYYIEVTDQSPCTELDSVYLDAPDPIQVQLTVNDVLCNGDATGSAMVDTVLNATGNYSQIGYFWSPSGSGGQGLGADSQTDLSAGNYALTVNDENGCSAVFDFSVSEPLPLAFQEFGGEPCTDSTSGVIWMSATGGTGDYDYLWIDLCDTTNQSSNTTWAPVYSPCCYKALVTDENGCVLTDTICMSCVSIPEVEFEFELYPNPSKGKFVIKSELNGHGVVKIYNSAGILVFLDQVNSNKFKVELLEAPGVYWVMMETDHGIGKKRIIIE